MEYNDFTTPTPKLSELLTALVNLGGSDLHLSPQNRPIVRIDGHLARLNDYDPINADDSKAYAEELLTDEKQALLKSEQQVDASFTVDGLSRFRINVCDSRAGMAISLRVIPFEPPPIASLGIPQNMIDLALKPHGLVLVTGPTGSGKSTTLAAFIDKINRERDKKIVTIEDPIEYIHPSKRCLVEQRELGANCRSFASATKNVVREDPDIVLIGELRDLATIEEALRVAEMGHLTFATLHSNTAASTITRIIDVFPALQQAQIRTQLAEVLAGVMSQQLLPKKEGKGRVMALETMIPTTPIQNLIRENKINQINSAMATGQDTHQMITMNQSLCRLVGNGIVTRETAEYYSPNLEDFRNSVGIYQQTQRSRIPAPTQPRHQQLRA
jgi:twitching motility protein PilT